MRSIVLIVFAAMISCVSMSIARAVDPASLPAEKVDFTQLSYSPSDSLFYVRTLSGGFPPDDNLISEGLEEGYLPQRLVRRIRSLRPQDNLLLYVSALEEPDTPGLAQDELPLKELADLLNALPCKYVVTIIDLPTKSDLRWTVTIDEAASMADRCRMFKKGMTIFASRQFEPRLVEKTGESTFSHYFTTGLESGHANADGDSSITLWEAYAYAYWCTYARSARDRWRPQCAVYVLTEDWTAQPVMRAFDYFVPGPDEQRILFAQASIREPWGGIMGPPGPSGPQGPSGPNWMSWYQGPAPRDAKSGLSDWAWHDLRLLERKCDELEHLAVGLEEVRRSLPIGRPLPDNKMSLPVGAQGMRGPMGSPAPMSEKVRSAREEAISNISDEGNRASAKRNSDLLTDLGMLAQDLESKATGAMSEMERPYRYFPAGDAGAACGVPTVWPDLLGVYNGFPLGPVGPRGMPGYTPPDGVLELTDKAQYSLWSPGFSNALASIRTRLERAQRIISKPGWKR